MNEQNFQNMKHPTIVYYILNLLYRTNSKSRFGRLIISKVVVLAVANVVLLLPLLLLLLLLHFVRLLPLAVVRF